MPSSAAALGPHVVLVAGDPAAAERVAGLLARGAGEPAAPGAPAVLLVVQTGPPSRLVAAVREAVGEHPGLAPLLVADALRGGAVRKVLAAGALGVVLLDELERTLEPTIAGVRAGCLVLPGALQRDVLPPALSLREKQALGLVVMGFSNAEISAKLFLTESTVKSHLSSAFRKLGVGSRSEATARILHPEEGLGLGILAISQGEARLGPAAREPAAPGA